VQLKQAGWRQREIAAAFGVTEVTVSRWLARARDGGIEVLLDHPSLSRPPRLSAAQRGLIPEFLWHGPEAYGFRGHVWTCARFAKVIEQEFGIAYLTRATSPACSRNCAGLRRRRSAEPPNATRRPSNSGAAISGLS
jgi:transposase